MEEKALKKHIEQALNLGLSLQGDSTRNNSFFIEIVENGFIFVPRMPCSYLVNKDLARKIFSIASISLYPHYTLIKQDFLNIIDRKNTDISVARGLLFPWKIGIPERLIFSKEELKAYKVVDYQIPLMKNFCLDMKGINHILISGTSGSGKSFALIYLLTMLHKITDDISIIDPKRDVPTIWANEHNISVLKVDSEVNMNSYLNSVNDILEEKLKLIYKRQEQLENNKNILFSPSFIVIDELLALTTMVNKDLKEEFFSLLMKISLLGRATKVSLVLSSQRFDAKALPVAVREQANCYIQLGHINKNTTQFLFPELQDTSEDIPISVEKGSGLIQVIDGVHSPDIAPVLIPTIKEWT